MSFQETTFPASCSLLTLADVTDRLRLSRPTLSKLIRDGRLATVRIGRRRFVTPEALQRFIKEAEGAAR